MRPQTVTDIHLMIQPISLKSSRSADSLSHIAKLVEKIIAYTLFNLTLQIFMRNLFYVKHVRPLK